MTGLDVSIKDNNVIDLGSISLVVDSSDRDDNLYQCKGSYEELNNPIYQEIRDMFDPRCVIDIGANYGFTGVFYSENFPLAKVILVEASAILCAYLEKNMINNNCKSFQVINAICAEVDGDKRSFSLNPHGSQDNRVVELNAHWKSCPSTIVSLNQLFLLNPSEFYFIKIDTKAYVKFVFKGGEEYLDDNNNWIIKTEFAPFCLKSQGTNPLTFLKWLTSRYNVSEIPLRTRFQGDTLNKVMHDTISAVDAEDFINYICDYNKNRTGWCDLMVAPKTIKQPS